jgi:hypothetical protein
MRDQTCLLTMIAIYLSASIGMTKAYDVSQRFANATPHKRSHSSACKRLHGAEFTIRSVIIVGQRRCSAQQSVPLFFNANKSLRTLPHPITSTLVDQSRVRYTRECSSTRVYHQNVAIHYCVEYRTGYIQCDNTSKIDVQIRSLFLTGALRMERLNSATSSPL